METIVGMQMLPIDAYNLAVLVGLMLEVEGKREEVPKGVLKESHESNSAEMKVQSDEITRLLSRGNILPGLKHCSGGEPQALPKHLEPQHPPRFDLLPRQHQSTSQRHLQMRPTFVYRHYCLREVEGVGALRF